MKIVFLDTKTMGNVSNLHLLEQFGEVVYYPLTPAELTAQRTADVDIAITCKVVIDQKVIDASPSLRLICAAATGINHIDSQYAISKGIEVCNVSDYSTNSVAQTTFAHILSLLNHVRYYDQFVKDGSYSKYDMFSHMDMEIGEIFGKTFGVIGLGAIGRKVAAIAEAFGANACYYSTSGNNNNSDYKRVSLDELLESSDIITIHAPLNDNTKNLMDIDKLKLMKPSAILVNVARGGIVVEKDLAYAIDNKLIAGAATDVFSIEPVKADNPLLQISNQDKMSFSPHCAWTSIEARTKLIEGIAQNIRRFLYK